MRSDLDHLPEAKRRELERVVQILFEEFEAATTHRSHQHLKHGRILKVVLFGSYARGDWVAGGADQTLAFWRETEAVQRNSSVAACIVRYFVHIGAWRPAHGRDHLFRHPRKPEEGDGQGRG